MTKLHFKMIMIVKGFIRFSVLMLVMYSGNQCKAENRWISHPDQTTAVEEGSNVTLRWRYTLSNEIVSLTFGLWKSSGYIMTKFLHVKSSEPQKPQVRKELEGRVLFEGTLSNPGNATITILNVSLQDSKEYGFEIDMGIQQSSFKHRFTLLVYPYPTSPRIVTQEIITHSHLLLSWKQPTASHLYPITMYTVWIRKNQSQWRTFNTTLIESIVALWGEGRYEFGVTAWNRWTQSSLEVNNTVTIARPSSASVDMATKKTPHANDIYLSNQTGFKTTHHRTGP